MPIITDRGRRGGGIAVNPQVPDAPVLAGTPGNAVVHLSWTIPSDNGSAITTFRVYRGGVLVASPAGTTFDDTGRVNGTPYTYRVTAVNAIGESTLSNLVTVTPVADVPAAPVLSGTAGDARADLSWTAPANGGAAISTYRVYRGGVFLTSVSAPTLTLADLTAVNGTPYTYRVSAVNSTGEGPQSNAVILTPTAGGSGVPALLPDITAGVPASNMIGIGGFQVGSSLSPGGFATFKSQGWAGFGQAVDTRNGGPLGKNASTQNDSMTGPYVWQRANEGWSAVGINVAAPGDQNAPNNGIGERNVHNADPSFRGFWAIPWPQMTNWFDDAEAAALATKWGGWAGAMNYLGMKGFYTDSEAKYNPLNIPAGQTRTTTFAKIEQRGYEVGLQVYANYPGFHWNFYSPVPSGSLWDRVYHNVISAGGTGTGTSGNRDSTSLNGPTNPPGGSPEMPFVLGMMKAGAELGSTGTISWLDHHIGYRADYSGLAGSLDDAIKVSWAGMIHRLSADLAPAVRDHWMGKFHWKAYHWAETDCATPPQFYQNTEPDSATYNSWLMTFRRWSGDGERFEFVYHLTPTAAAAACSRWAALANPYAAVPGRLAGMQAAASTASQDSSALIVSAISQSRVGSTVTLTFTFAHAYGPRNVHWTLFAANGTTVNDDGEAAMDWSLINTRPYPNPVTTANSFMTCTCTIPNATAGRYVNLDAYTVIGQRTSRRVQLV